MKILKYLSLMIAGALIMGMIAGCSVYTKEDLAEYTKRRLKEEYGEEFEIKTVIDGNRTIAYPVRDPELLFNTFYVMSNEKGNNKYLHALVEKQHKELVEEKFKDFEYKYYVDINIGSPDLKGADTSITIEEYDKLAPGGRPSYDLYLSYDVLRQSDEELYEFFESITSIHPCGFGVYFIINSDFDVILRDFSSSPTLSSETNHYLNGRYKAIRSSTDYNGKWKMSFEDFKEIMKEVRNNELYR